MMIWIMVMMTMIIMKMKWYHNDDLDDGDHYLQLKREKGVEREKISVTIKDLIQYVKDQAAVRLRGPGRW